MENVDKQELCPYQKRDKHAKFHEALENWAFVDEDYAKYLLFLKDGGVSYGGDNPSCTCNDVEDDQQYMNFLANSKPDGTSYVYKFNDQNGLPVFIKYEEDEELEINGVEKGQDDVREKYKMGESSKGLKDNARENRELEIHGVERGQDDVRGKYKMGESSKGLNYIARENRELEIHRVEKGQDGVRGKYKMGESSKRLKDNARENRELEIHGVEKGQDGVRGKYKMGESSTGLKDNARENRELEIHRVEKGQTGVRGKYKLGESSEGLKANVRENRMKDGILSKKQGNEDRDLVKRKHIIDVNIIPGKEQKIQDDSKFMDAKVKIEPKEDFDSLKEAISQSEVEILENVGAELGMGSSSNPFVPSVEHCLNLDATIIDSRYRKEVLNLLRRPYNEEEYKKLWKDIKMQLPSSSTNGRGKSFLSLHKDVNRAIKMTNHNKDKKLNIMRGFFFWLEHLTRQDAFQPWEDEECLQTMPGSS